MATYKTPGVYVEEISLFPPSVAEVETAIPAFIGYTEKAQKIIPNDLHHIPTPVTSLLEYSELFGGPAPVLITSIKLDAANTVKETNVDLQSYMYESLRLFFGNGGGKCYIVSVGTWNAGAPTVQLSDFYDAAKTNAGLRALERVDEPTILVFPDAVMLNKSNGTGLFEVQRQALRQCNHLQDRVAVCDLYEEPRNNTFDWQKNSIDAFRDNIGVSNLKYGAAYTPWVRVNPVMSIGFRNLSGKVLRTPSDSEVLLESQTSDKEILATISGLKTIIADSAAIESACKSSEAGTLMNTAITATLGKEPVGDETMMDIYTDLITRYMAEVVAATKVDKFKELVSFVYKAADVIDTWANTLTNESLAGRAAVVGHIQTKISAQLAGYLTTLVKLDETLHLNDDGLSDGYGASIHGAADYLTTTFTAAQWNAAGITAAAIPELGVILADEAASLSVKLRAAEKLLTPLAEGFYAAIKDIKAAAVKIEADADSLLYQTYPLYKQIIDEVTKALTPIPPSGAIAGLYAFVDSNRGVWKAPANVSLNSVTGLTQAITQDEQKDLNVDAVAGKSINAIRAFTGRGLLVWGARTLAGNDNEWRYISVRRFYNMVEESVKKSTYWAVFEPNDANTWIKVKSMIENYLTQKWREGALAGSKPEQAFFVKIGLGVTMTSQDVLEGRMNVEIGMAAVRPAEFIILKFSHKLQQA